MKAFVLGISVLVFTAAAGLAGWVALSAAEDPRSIAMTVIPVVDSPPPGPRDDSLAASDGFVAEGDSVSPFANELAAIAQLQPALRRALQDAADDAARDGVELRVTSGWRSDRYQQALMDEAIAKYGSEVKARRWVATPEQSTHVTGDAVDVGPAEAYEWLGEHGAEYGLCRAYANEPWHFELATRKGGACPRPARDASGVGLERRSP
ncbi:hypothetical protein AYO38_01200 [bacterium SCGC AG-212-C10]|nr:hypothetical protein AYO38_01200 [bacterium SCGC AG-212-C10]